jgi:hypothetical protein
MNLPGCTLFPNQIGSEFIKHNSMSSSGTCLLTLHRCALMRLNLENAWLAPYVQVALLELSSQFIYR